MRALVRDEDEARQLPWAVKAALRAGEAQRDLRDDVDALHALQ